MKHLLNNLSETEKNAIREQHTGRMKVVTENFTKLLNSKLGDAKPIVESDSELEEQLGGGRTNMQKDKLLTDLVGKTVQLGQNLFKLGSDEINTGSEEFRKAVNIFSKITPESKESVTIQGGASSVGSKNGYDNKGLAERRAKNFINALKDAGVNTTNFSVVPGVVTPNTDVANSPEANAAQFVRFTVASPNAAISQQLGRDNTSREIIPISKIVGPKKQKDQETDKNYYRDYRIVFPKNISSNEIYEILKQSLKGKVIKVTML